MDTKIQLGDYIVIQRQKYRKLHKFANAEAKVALGKEFLEVQNLLDQPYGMTFKMCPKEKESKRSARVHTLELCSDAELRNLRDVLGISASGSDNRNLVDDGESQTLRSEDIAQLRNECQESTEIIAEIVRNSKTFQAKTEYSQEKYLKKKEKKYFEYIQIHKPNIRMMHEIYYRQEPERILGLRVDSLAQVLVYANISGYTNCLLYESGSNGLLPASFLNLIGENTEAHLVHMHPGNFPQKQAMAAMKFPEEQMQRCISVNMYSVLRQYFQSETDDQVVEPSSKKPKLDLEAEETEKQPEGEGEDDGVDDEVVTTTPTTKKATWRLDNERALKFLNEKLDSLVVVTGKEHPASIINELLPFLKPSSPIVVFNTVKEILTEVYVDMKSAGKVNNLHLCSNWLRSYQILPNRTHPEVNRNGNSGFILYGYTVS